MSTDVSKIHRFKTHRRTVTEPDIVTFVNTVGLHEPFFIDMEYIKANMSPEHQRRFAPGPFIISMAMGLVAPIVTSVIDKVLEGETVGPFGGMTGVEARIKGVVYPGDTLHVEGEARIKAKTSRGYTLLDLRHMVINQSGEMVADFTETILFMPLEST